MKKGLLFIIGVFCISSILLGQVIITGVMDGPLPGGSPKFVELYVNTTTDLSGWALRSHNNGNTGVSSTTPLGGLGTINSGQYIYVIYMGHDDEFRTWFGLSIAQYNALNAITGPAPNINGNDAVSLNDGTSNVDVFGVIGTDGTGEPWEYTDGWASGANSSPGSFSLGSWNFSGTNALDGKTDNADAAPNSFPSGNPDLLILPIELLSFTAFIKNNQAILNWETATELNNDYMAIEHSTNGRDFSEIGRIKGAGSTTITQEYSFIDSKPAKGINYYRLRQVDFDGHTEYHRIVSVTVDKKGDLVVAPTEVQDAAMIYLPGTLEQPAQLRIYDINGRLWKNTSLNAGIKQIPFHLGDLPIGHYVLQLIDERDVSIARFNKL